MSCSNVVHWFVRLWPTLKTASTFSILLLKMLAILKRKIVEEIILNAFAHLHTQTLYHHKQIQKILQNAYSIQFNDVYSGSRPHMVRV